MLQTGKVNLIASHKTMCYRWLCELLNGYCFFRWGRLFHWYIIGVRFLVWPVTCKRATKYC